MNIDRIVLKKELNRIIDNINPKYTNGEIMYAIVSPISRKSSDLLNLSNSDVIQGLEDVLERESPEEEIQYEQY